MNDIKISSNRSFGLVFCFVFLIIGFFPLFENGNPRIWSIIIAIIFLFLGLLNSKILLPLNKLWFKFGLFLGKIISPLIMAIIFFIVVTPTGFIMRIFKKDILELKFNNKKTYWVEKNDLKSNMKNQF